MRYDSTEIGFTNKASRTRRIWYGHGSSRLITENPRELPPADIIDEALPGFVPARATKKPVATTIAAKDRRPVNISLAASLAAQLDVLDRQREQLAKLLRSIDDTAITK